MTNTLHAHVSMYSVDCDGPISREYVLNLNDEERGDFGDILFHERVLSHVVNTYSLMDSGVLTVRRHEDGVSLDWSEPTDEGSRNVSARICNDVWCDTSETLYRDHRAESMGY